jgi:Predicted kinase related to dihydroxyacetone kinase
MREQLDGLAFRDMVISAAASVEDRKEEINELNVFPVPDGDTGTNMSLTLNAAASELAGEDPENPERGGGQRGRSNAQRREREFRRYPVIAVQRYGEGS